MVTNTMLTVFGRVVPWHKDCWRHRAKKPNRATIFSISASSKRLMDFHSQCPNRFGGFPTVDGSEIWQTTWDVSQNPVNNGISTTNLNWWVYRISEPSRVLKSWCFFGHGIPFWRSVSQFFDDRIGADNRTGKIFHWKWWVPQMLGIVSQMDVLKWVSDIFHLETELFKLWFFMI